MAEEDQAGASVDREDWRDRDHPFLDIVTWFLGGLAGLFWLLCLAAVASYKSADLSTQVEGYGQLAGTMTIALPFAGGLAFTGLASLAAYARYRRPVWLIGAGLTLAVCLAMRFGLL